MNGSQDSLMCSPSRLQIPRLRLRFTLRAVLVLMLLIACIFAAFRAGRRQGYDRGFQAGKWSVEAKMMSTQIYQVADLIGAAKDFDTLIDLLTKSVTPLAWEENGGNSAVEPFPTNSVLVISHTNEGHQRIARFLSQLRARSRVVAR